MALILGTAANDTLTGTAAADTMRGGDGDDFIDGLDGIDSIFAGAGNDILVAHGLVPSNYDQPGTAVAPIPDHGIYDGGDGFDYLVMPSTVQAMSFVYPSGFEGQSVFTSIEAIRFQTGAPLLSGQIPPSLTFTSKLASEFPSDLLLEGVGNLRINMVEFGSFDASSFRFAPNSQIQITIAATFLDRSGPIMGSSNDDRILGNSSHDDLFGGGGSDSITGEAGNDHLYGRSAIGGVDGADTISGGSGSDYIQGNAGNDFLDGGDGSDRINGGADNDSIIADAGNDSVNGNLGDDTISGGAGNDSLRGGRGNDSISGGDGNDILSGDLGSDTLSGGAGRDRFLFSGQASSLANPDVITDFDAEQDQLFFDYTPAAALTGAVQVNYAAAASLAQQLFDGHGGDQETASIAVGADRYIFYSSSGGGTVDSAILLQGLNITTTPAQDFAEAS